MRVAVLGLCLVFFASPEFAKEKSNPYGHMKVPKGPKGRIRRTQTANERWGAIRQFRQRTP